MPLRKVQPLGFDAQSVHYQNIIIYDVMLLMGEALKHKFLPPWGFWTFLCDVGVSGYGLALSNRVSEPQASYPFILKVLLARRLFILAGEGMTFFGQEGIDILDKILWATLCAEGIVSIYFSCQMASNDNREPVILGTTPRG